MASTRKIKHKKDSGDMIYVNVNELDVVAVDDDDVYTKTDEEDVVVDMLKDVDALEANVSDTDEEEAVETEGVGEFNNMMSEVEMKS